MLMSYIFTIICLSCKIGCIGWCRMDEMMRRESGRRELAMLEDKADKFSPIDFNSMCSPVSEEFDDLNDSLTEEVLSCS